MDGNPSPPGLHPFVMLSGSEAQTLEAGEALAATLRPGDTVLLEGELGAGKTVFARGLARGLGVDPREVRSPSFTLVNVYRGRLPVYHIDLYRVEEPRDLIEIGLEDWIGTDGVAVVEWSERLGPYHPSCAIKVQIEHRDGDERSIMIWDGR